MNRNRFVVGKYVIDFMSRPKKTPEELTEFFQKIMDDSRNMTCEEIRNYMKSNLVNKVNVMVDNLDMEIEAAIEYLETKIQDSPDQLKLEL
jgi:uncharacterized protein (DUF1499 family)